ncbi:MAG: hypothetical protein GDA36_07670 [Rhodobacteraceae bacterium]|nr:hypothetical protein [Paracoccaceae bacterium]
MHLFLRKTAVRIGADDVLSKIDALMMNWRWCSPIHACGLGCSGIGP